MDESSIIGCGAEAFKTSIKKKIKIAAFKFLRSKQKKNLK